MRSPGQTALLALCCVAALAACVRQHVTGRDTTGGRCPVSAGGPLLVFELFFGRSIPPAGEVTDRDWEVFVAEVVTPALPRGFTVSDASGSWMSPVSQRTVHERTKVLIAALPDSPGDLVTIDRIRNAYRRLFRQQVVGMTVTPACGAF